MNRFHFFQILFVTGVLAGCAPGGSNSIPAVAESAANERVDSEAFVIEEVTSPNQKKTALLRGTPSTLPFNIYDDVHVVIQEAGQPDKRISLNSTFQQDDRLHRDVLWWDGNEHLFLTTKSVSEDASSTQLAIYRYGLQEGQSPEKYLVLPTNAEQFSVKNQRFYFLQDQQLLMLEADKTLKTVARFEQRPDFIWATALDDTWLVAVEPETAFAIQRTPPRPRQFYAINLKEKQVTACYAAESFSVPQGNNPLCPDRL